MGKWLIEYEMNEELIVNGTEWRHVNWWTATHIGMSMASVTTQYDAPLHLKGHNRGKTLYTNNGEMKDYIVITLHYLSVLGQ